MQKKEFKSIIYEYASIEELNETDLMLINKAKKSALKAYAPYSGFSVGVCLLLVNGEFILGNNQENVAYPSGLCAERVAVFFANSNYPEESVQSIAVCAYNGKNFTPDPIHPCGACLQVLIETEQRFKLPIRLILFGEKKIQVVESINQLLPLHFKK